MADLSRPVKQYDSTLNKTMVTAFHFLLIYVHITLGRTMTGTIHLMVLVSLKPLAFKYLHDLIKTTYLSSWVIQYQYYNSKIIRHTDQNLIWNWVLFYIISMCHYWTSFKSLWTLSNLARNANTYFHICYWLQCTVQSKSRQQTKNMHTLKNTNVLVCWKRLLKWPEQQKSDTRLWIYTAYLAIVVIAHVPHRYKGIKHGAVITGRHKVLTSHHCWYCPAADKTGIFTFINLTWKQKLPHIFSFLCKVFLLTHSHLQIPHHCKWYFPFKVTSFYSTQVNSISLTPVRQAWPQLCRFSRNS